MEWQALNKNVFSRVGPAGYVEVIAFDYLMYSGYIVLAYQWLQIAKAASIKTDIVSKERMSKKLVAARYCFFHVLPRASAHREAILIGGDVILNTLEH